MTGNPVATQTGTPGPLVGLKVIELASEYGAFAGKMLADLGAEVVLVEPLGGHHTRAFEPFLDDEPGPERSLWWWHYNTSKRGVVLDLQSPQGAASFAGLVAGADIVLEAEHPDRLHGLGLDHTQLRATRPELIWVSVTPFGRASDLPRRHELTTDLTVLAGGGPVWNCGYDDHTLPPVRGGGNQGYQTACLWAVSSALAAVLHREISGRGQHCDVSMHAAANVTTEAGSYEWLVANATVQRQTGRHAAVNVTQFTRTTGTDGIDIHTGFPPRSVAEYQAVVDWIDEIGARDDFADIVLLEMAVERGGVQLWELGSDPLAMEMFGAGRDAFIFVAQRLGAYEFFHGAQQRGLACAVILAPEEVFEDEHYVARGFRVEVEHPELGRSVTYPGAPFLMPASPWKISSRSPQLGEHQHLVDAVIEKG